MKKLLRNIAPPRGEKPQTGSVSNEFLNILKVKDQNLVIDTLDLFKVKLPDFYGNAFDAKYALMNGGILEEQTKTSLDEISKHPNEFLAYDAYLISRPMWN